MTPIIYKTSDQYGDILVIENGQIRNLTFDSAYEQSSIDKSNPNFLVHEYMQAMMLVLAFSKPAQLIIFGLGAGCLARSVNQISPDCDIEAIELRQAVYAIAQEFFNFPSSSKIKVTIANAHYWVKNAKANHVSVIMSDLFHADGMDVQQQHKNFIHHCHRVLDKKGWLVMNYHKIPDADAEFFQMLKNLFSDIFICSIDSGNNIIFASKTPIKLLSQFDSRVSVLEKKLGISLRCYLNKMKRITFSAR